MHFLAKTAAIKIPNGLEFLLVIKSIDLWMLKHTLKAQSDASEVMCIQSSLKITTIGKATFRQPTIGNVVQPPAQEPPEGLEGMTKKEMIN